MQWKIAIECLSHKGTNYCHKSCFKTTIFLSNFNILLEKRFKLVKTVNEIVPKMLIMSHSTRTACQVLILLWNPIEIKSDIMFRLIIKCYKMQKAQIACNKLFFKNISINNITNAIMFKECYYRAVYSFIQ